jgi:uncharacterized SAM-binding protein YcdF (DUF218 family)
MTQQRRILLICLGIGAAFAVSLWLAGLSGFVHETEALSPPATLQKEDAIVVLTGGSNRLDAGFDLLEKGFGKKLFISGVYKGLEVKQLLKLWKDEPQSHLDCCVVLGFEADNTVGNAVETIDWLKKEGYHSIYLVTANYHLKRALLEFSSLAPDLNIVPFPVVPGPATTKFLIPREYFKYLMARLHHSVTH